MKVYLALPLVVSPIEIYDLPDIVLNYKSVLYLCSKTGQLKRIKKTQAEFPELNHIDPIFYWDFKFNMLSLYDLVIANDPIRIQEHKRKSYLQLLEKIRDM